MGCCESVNSKDQHDISILLPKCELPVTIEHTELEKQRYTPNSIVESQISVLNLPNYSNEPSIASWKVNNSPYQKF